MGLSVHAVISGSATPVIVGPRTISIMSPSGRILPEEDSTVSPNWTSNWTVQNPGGTQFIQNNGQVTINHAVGTQDQDYLQCGFEPLQNVSFEFDAQIGSAGNTDWTLLIEVGWRPGL